MRYVASVLPRAVVGVLLGVLGLAIVVFAVRASIDALRMADTLQIIAEGRHEPFDRANWQAHWRTASVVDAVLGMGILLAGVGLLRRRQWGLLAFCMAISVVLAWMVAMRKFGAYAFEEASLGGTLTVAFLCLALWVVFWRNRRRH